MAEAKEEPKKLHRDVEKAIERMNKRRDKLLADRRVIDAELKQLDDSLLAWK